MKLLVLLVSFVAVANCQLSDFPRYILSGLVPEVNQICQDHGYAYYIADVFSNGSLYADTTMYVHKRHTMPCPRGTLFSSTATQCGCILHYLVQYPYLRNQERCITILGNFQNDEDFRIQQRGDPGFYPLFAGGFNSYIPDFLECFASNIQNNQFRSIDFLSNNSLSRDDFNISVGFSASGVNGREFDIITNGRCPNDLTSPPSFEVKYVSGAGAATLTVSMRVTDRNLNRAGETLLTANCQIDTNIPVPGGNIGDFFIWNANDATNQISVASNFGDRAPLSVQLTNQNMRTRGHPQGGFCRGATVNVGPRARARSYMVARRNCPLAFGQAPANEWMCMYDFRFVRDCGSI